MRICFFPVLFLVIPEVNTEMSGGILLSFVFCLFFFFFHRVVVTLIKRKLSRKIRTAKEGQRNESGE